MKHTVDACLLTAALAATIGFASPAAAENQQDDLSALRLSLIHI